MAGTDFIDAFRSTFMGQRDQVKAEKKAEKAEAKAKQAEAEASKAQEEAKAGEEIQATQERIGNFLNNLRDMVTKATEEATTKLEEKTKVEEPTVEAAPVVDDEYTVSYTYKPGDTFGQVLTDLGLKSDAGLWGTDGDVAYYTKQLEEQGALDNNGNIPIGTTIKLRRRGAPEIQMDIGKQTTEAKYPELQKVRRSGPTLV